jgi:hypothetical protein
MALQNCPKCGKKRFTWTVDEEVSQLTLWYCNACGYSAQEDEKKVRKCVRCGEPGMIRLADADGAHWWCFRCGAFEDEKTESERT